MTQTFGEYFEDHPQYDAFSIPEKDRVFKEPGRYSVILMGPMQLQETVEIEVSECGGFTILST